MRRCKGSPQRERRLWQPDRRPRVRLREPTRQESAVARSACPRARRPGALDCLARTGVKGSPSPQTAATPARRNRQPRVRHGGRSSSLSVIPPGSGSTIRLPTRCKDSPHKAPPRGGRPHALPSTPRRSATLWKSAGTIGLGMGAVTVVVAAPGVTSSGDDAQTSTGREQPLPQRLPRRDCSGGR